MITRDVIFVRLVIQGSLETGRCPLPHVTCLPLLAQLPLGRQCVEHYRLLHRYCVFSHDEMICKMASKADVLDVVVASTVQKDMAIMIEDEKVLRETVRKLVRFLKLPSECHWGSLSTVLTLRTVLTGAWYCFTVLESPSLQRPMVQALCPARCPCPCPFGAASARSVLLRPFLQAC